MGGDEPTTVLGMAMLSSASAVRNRVAAIGKKVPCNIIGARAP